ncbi:hypothetical protein yberc0001_10790 [Yersinia bercovieri ATCC 43970]|uniref:Uncharacterized protein n=1 Tax=Yersinia bercovieri ATCC 43970 TaxID=349968 RepID=A0ABM9XYP1_YERBE|nr:hypothetical protein yberc0001_10790 [Yersinia bercovieri ATCC 43970]
MLARSFIFNRIAVSISNYGIESNAIYVLPPTLAITLATSVLVLADSIQVSPLASVVVLP